MNLLLDTCSFLWITTDAEQLTPKVKEIFTNKQNQIYLSVVSMWEITVKYKLGGSDQFKMRVYFITA
jgi:PIN domain nuclease of toxin-antitoxin system